MEPVVRTAERVGSPAFVHALRHHGDAPAVLAPSGPTWSHAELADRVDEVAEQLGGGRRLVAVVAGSDRGSLVAHLGALRAGHVVQLVPPGRGPAAAALLEAYDPDVVLTGGAGDRPEVRQRRSGSAHELHPELSLLLSTSGSTGSPKLVRLGAPGVQANAEAIAAALGLRPDDCAALTLPLHYCYGLSVVHSHLQAGASVLVGAGSVVDADFWAQVRRHRCTSFAAVPHTFELLDRVGFEAMDLPSLRAVTQAGGRLAPAVVRRYAGYAERDGWELHVMYGQTEATARMACLPPGLARSHPASIGRAIPGGHLAVEPPPGEAGTVPDGEVGELVYRGPNVMMGYAEVRTDLARGHEVDALRTGDLARRAVDGTFEVVGRANRIAKPFGLRIDLDRVEAVLAEEGVAAVCAGTDRGLAVVAVGPRAEGRLALDLADRFGLPRRAVVVAATDEFPRLPNGKPDRTGAAALAQRAFPSAPEDGGERPLPPADGPGGPTEGPTGGGVREVLAEVLGVEAVGDADTFVGLGGDSLSYVEASLRLESVLGELPAAWHTTAVVDLERAAPRRRRGRVVEANVVLRALAIALVVGTHASLFRIQGGAHVLLAVAGFNFARFRLTAGEVPDRARHAAASIARVAVPVVAWVLFTFTWREAFSWPRLFLVDNVLGEGVWRYWYAEVLLQVLVAATLVLGVRSVREAERRRPFAAAMALLGVAVVLRTGWPLPGASEPMYRTDTVLWLFAVGWAAHRADTPARRALVSAAVVVALPGFFDSGLRGAVVAVGLLALVWVPWVRLPRAVVGPVSAVAAASLHVFLTHYAVLPWLRPHAPPWVVVPVALVVGVAAWAGSERLRRRWARRRASTRAGGYRPSPSAGSSVGSGPARSGSGSAPSGPTAPVPVATPSGRSRG